MGSRENVVLDEVDFSFVDCRDVIFSKFNPFVGFDVDIEFASFKNCSFIESQLSGALFKGAHLEWTAEHPAELGVWHEFPDEPPAFQQTHYPTFWHADLSGTSFADARFKNADFREAEGILKSDFTGAKGLESCLFDDETTKKAVLKMSHQKVED